MATSNNEGCKFKKSRIVSGKGELTAGHVVDNV